MRKTPFSFHNRITKNSYEGRLTMYCSHSPWLWGPVFGQGFQVRGKVSQKITLRGWPGASVTVKEAPLSQYAGEPNHRSGKQSSPGCQVTSARKSGIPPVGSSCLLISRMEISAPSNEVVVIGYGARKAV